MRQKVNQFNLYFKFNFFFITFYIFYLYFNIIIKYSNRNNQLKHFLELIFNYNIYLIFMLS